MHTAALLTGFDCHFDHPQQYKIIMLLPVKNSIVHVHGTCMYVCLLHIRFDSIHVNAPWQVYPLYMYIKILTDFDPCGQKKGFNPKTQFPSVWLHRTGTYMYM